MRIIFLVKLLVSFSYNSAESSCGAKLTEVMYSEMKNNHRKILISKMTWLTLGPAHQVVHILHSFLLAFHCWNSKLLWAHAIHDPGPLPLCATTSCLSFITSNSSKGVNCCISQISAWYFRRKCLRLHLTSLLKRSYVKWIFVGLLICACS